MAMVYTLERDLVNDFLGNLRVEDNNVNPWGILPTAIEFNYVRGRTDVIGLTYNQEIMAFEMKLKRWRDALHQAYRNTCFAHYSYIVIPEDVANKAFRSAYNTFSKLSVGICYIGSNGINILMPAKKITPLQRLLTGRAEQYILENGGNDINDTRASCENYM